MLSTLYDRANQATTTFLEPSEGGLYYQHHYPEEEQRRLTFVIKMEGKLQEEKILWRKSLKKEAVVRLIKRPIEKDCIVGVLQSRWRAEGLVE